MRLDQGILLFLFLSVFIALVGLWMVGKKMEYIDSIKQTYPDIAIDIIECNERLKGRKNFELYGGE